MLNIIKDKSKKKTKKKVTKKVQKLNLPKTVPHQKELKKNTTAYYHCLANHWGKGKITDCCAKCKKDAGVLSNLRTAEIKKLISAYQQVGISLTKLLKPAK